MNGLKEMAIEAGMHYRQIEDEFCKANADGVPMEMLEAFAKLVAAKEREAVLDLVDAYAKNNTDLADAIRARGEA
jgi:hypothetical protein